MKKLFSFIILIFWGHFAICQNFGFRGNLELSHNKIINNAHGFGGFVNFRDFSEDIELLISLDYNTYNKQIPDEDLKTTYNRLFFSINGLYNLSLLKKLKLKIGPGISYHITNASDRGIILRWINTYKAKFIGAELVTNFHFPKVLELPINFDIFITPAYLINIESTSNPLSIKSDYSGNREILNLQIGLSYNIN
jgi:hypothetical protein